MPALAETATREPSLIAFADHPPIVSSGLSRWTARAQNFRVDWLRADSDSASFDHRSADETMLLVLQAPVTIAAAEGGLASAAGAPVEAAPRSICILPPGRWRVQPARGSICIVLASLRGEAAAGAVNDEAYASPDPRIKALGRPYVALRGNEVRVMSIDEIKAPADKPRLKMIQTATLSINWVEYEGARDAGALSPHSHADFEQGSLAVVGDFVHHLRVPWGADARLWREDRHERLGSPSLLVVPVGMVHTTEGVGPGRHLLIDLFSPPRADFIAKGWIANAADYRAPEPA